jgi:hypothetical protein
MLEEPLSPPLPPADPELDPPPVPDEDDDVVGPPPLELSVFAGEEELEVQA